MWRLAIALAILIAGEARAAPASGIDVAWTAPAGCPDAGALGSLLADHLGRHPDARDRLTAIVRVEQRERDYRATILVRGPGRRLEREVAGGRCDTVTDAAALVLALAVERHAPVELGTAEPPPPPRARPIADEQVAPAPRPAIAARLLVGGSAGTGMLPASDLGVSAGLALGLGAWWLEAEGTAWAARGLEVLGGNAEIDAETAAVRGCWRRRAWVPCIGIETGRMRGEGHDFEDPGAGAALWLAVAPGLGADLSLGRGWHLTARAELAMTLSAPRFTMAGAPVHEPGALIGRLAVGLAAPLF
jgi:hypothetical protein